MIEIIDRKINYVIPRNSKKSARVLACVLKKIPNFVKNTPSKILEHSKHRNLSLVEFLRIPRNSKLAQLFLICIVWNFREYLRISRNSSS